MPKEYHPPRDYNQEAAILRNILYQYEVKTPVDIQPRGSHPALGHQTFLF
jgi:hypothetical protein